MRATLLISSFILSLSLSAQDRFTKIHLSETLLQIKSTSLATLKVHKKWTIYSDVHSDHGDVAIAYGFFQKVKGLELTIKTPKDGKTKKLKQKDFRDESLSEGFEIDDSRLLYHSFSSTSYPVTLELSYELKINGLFFLPDWMPLSLYDAMLEDASFTIEAPTSYNFRYKTQGVDNPVIENKGNMTTYNWKIDEPLKSLPKEPYSPVLREYMPMVNTSPGAFELSNSEGDLYTWQGLGIWLNSLMEGRTELPVETVELLQNRFGNIRDTVERVKKVYEWMQGHTRYVSTQLGISGWQPATALEVDKNNYGDCKGLVNYTRAALKAVGINSNYCVVHSDVASDHCDPGFPSSKAFNHIILNVPLKNDTLWLECTSNKTPVNYVPDSYAGKHTLLVNGEQSTLVRVPDPCEHTLTANHTIDISLNDDGSVNLHSEIVYSDHLFGRYLGIQDESDKIQNKVFSRNVQAGNFHLENSNFTTHKDRQEVRCKADLVVEQQWQQLGDEILLSPNTHNTILPQLPANPNRVSNLVFKYNYQQTDTLSVRIPQGYVVNYLPESKNVETEFGKYNVFYIIEGEYLNIYASFFLRKGIYPPKKYSQVREFLMNAVDNLDRKIGLNKK